MGIKLSNVEFRNESQPILQNINIQIPSGKLTAICGQTGSGKSTLLQLITGLEKPNKGTIYHEEPTTDRISMVFQIPEDQLFAGTVQQDIEYGLKIRKIPKQQRLAFVKEALLLAGLNPADFLERSPFLLSGGEKRRVAIAGALVLKPDVLVLDEPTAGLDPEAQRELLKVLINLREKGMTIVVATHDLDAFFPITDQVLVMKSGQVIFQGRVEELVHTPNPLLVTGLELPTVTRMAYGLLKKGLDLGTPLTAEELISTLEKRIVGKQNSEGARNLSAEQTTSPLQTSPQEAALAGNQPTNSVIHQLDPRAKWFAMLCFSLVCLGITNGIGIVSAFILTIVLFQVARISWHRTWKFLRPFLIMYLFLIIISSIALNDADWSLGPIGFTLQGAITGVVGVARFLLVILLGLLFAETTSGAPLREGFEWALRPLQKLKIPTRDFSLAVSIALQFIPWIIQKSGHIRKALIARGQKRNGIQKWTPRELSVLVVALLISILKMGDELATAIESRGYNRQVKRTPWYKLKWTVTDTAACGITAFLSIVLWWLG